MTDEEIMAQVLAAFQEEQAEHCQAIGDLLLEMERDPNHDQRSNLLEQLFREAHSLKGGARAAGIDPVEHVAHRMEDVFSAVRQGRLALTPEVCDPIYASISAISTMMQQIAAGQTPAIGTYQHLLDDMSALLQPQQTEETAPKPEHEAVPEPSEQRSELLVDPDRLEQAAPSDSAVEATPDRGATPDDQLLTIDPPPQVETAAERSTPPASTEEVPWETASNTVRLATTVLDDLLNETGELITCAVRSEQRASQASTLVEFASRWRRLWRQINPVLAKLQQQIPTLNPTIHHLNGRDLSTNPTQQRAEQNRGYDTMIFIAQATSLIQILHQANDLFTELDQGLGQHARAMVEDHMRLATVTDRLHDKIRRTRMLPVSTLFNPMRLQMREMARAAIKQVVLEIDDGGAEADRQVLERLREVLLHLLRNAVDHGIEATGVRHAMQKSPVGLIRLQAAVSGDYLTIAVSDDGAGLDLEVIRQQALHTGLVSETELARMSETELIDLIFLSGFSTRKTVTNLSGRGVGLDIVRSQVERMHGQVQVESKKGQGCCFTISVPLLLTSSHGLLLKVGKATYMIPIESVQRIVPVISGDVQTIEGRPALVVEGRPIVLMHLSSLLSVDDKVSQYQTGEQNTALKQNGQSWALLLGSGERQVACMVDAVLGEQELVVHRLPPPLQRLRFIAGATILADGSVIPILDLVDLLRAVMGQRHMVHLVTEPEAVQRRHRVLVADDSITTRTLEKNILEAAGYHVQLATDGLEAFEMLHRGTEEGTYELLLSDIDMPRLNGFELTQQVRSDPQLKHLPVVLVTSLDTPADRQRGIASGADAYIVKRGFDQQTLLETIAHLIE
ncbi:MAG: hybrid sensor histidine kinase/response regulator [Chloroflexaceae bacterium]|nr:hybrid sensor histidine kinase/response regulator [Chloroflexaceae bacterium]